MDYKTLSYYPDRAFPEHNLQFDLFVLYEKYVRSLFQKQSYRIELGTTGEWLQWSISDSLDKILAT